MNLRSIWEPGCPAEMTPLQPHADYVDIQARVEQMLPSFWSQIFPNETMPSVIAAPCCAQFAVADWTIRRRSKIEYERIFNVLGDTSIEDNRLFGMMMEKLWHIVLSQPPVR